MQNQSFTSIPFKTESGVSTINGVAKFSSAGIVIEFEAKLFGIITNGVKEVQIRIEDILDVKFRNGFMRRGAKIELRAKSFAKLAEMPSNDGKMTLKIIRDDFERARDAVERLQRAMDEGQRSLPPTHTPISRVFDEHAADDIDR